MFRVLGEKVSRVFRGKVTKKNVEFVIDLVIGIVKEVDIPEKKAEIPKEPEVTVVMAVTETINTEIQKEESVLESLGDKMEKEFPVHYPTLAELYV